MPQTTLLHQHGLIRPLWPCDAPTEDSGCARTCGLPCLVREVDVRSGFALRSCGLGLLAVLLSALTGCSSSGVRVPRGLRGHAGQAAYRSAADWRTWAPIAAAVAFKAAGWDEPVSDHVAGSTTIDGDADDRVLHVDPADQGVSLHLNDVKVTNGFSDAGGGLRISNGLTVIVDSVFSSNVVTDTGGAIHLDYGSLRVLSTTLEHNTTGSSGYGGAIYIDKGAASLHASSVYSNTAHDGGGLYASYGSVSVVASDFLTNAATLGSSGNRVGGGIRQIIKRQYNHVVPDAHAPVLSAISLYSIQFTTS